MMLFLFLFPLALGAVSPSGELEVKLLRGSCPSFWFSFDGRCYKYVSTQLSWADAELYCVSQGANLVSIHSEGENNFVRSLVRNFDHAEGLTWIGLTDAHKEGNWMWSDGSAVKFTFWNSGQPDNYRGTEHCVHINYGTPKRWNDVTCTHTYPSVCATRKATCP
ncbi:lactose-binding lectin l-2-like [Solea solea]|uniref:lactose-binding lectin l-2-like n=1 Tax=Solea solea TaxID=90069 RepID=UPI00272AAD11|nr:lactose-binding lectin l-2-like [Solea solea]